MTRRRARLLALALAIAAMLALLVIAIAFGAVAARGWLCGFVLLSMVPIGSLALLLVHGISGGRWGRDLAPVLIPAARTMPLLLVGFAPVLLFRPLIYQWQDLKLPPDVFAYYLNPSFFDARSIIALAVWSLLAWSGAWRRELSAGLGLIAHLILTSLIPADWVLTLRPGSVSAGFGLGFGIEQMGAALAFAAVMVPQRGDARASRDLAGLIVTTLLGTVYFVYMQFVITWYGNIPDKVHWFADRVHAGWSPVAFAAFMIGAAVPFLAMLNPLVRGAGGALRLVGASVLTGITLHVAWLTVPAFGAGVLGPAVLAAIAMALIFLAASGTPVTARTDRADG